MQSCVQELDNATRNFLLTNFFTRGGLARALMKMDKHGKWIIYELGSKHHDGLEVC